jgi:hypothetical protein
MGNIHDVDENAPWRNDPLAKRAVMAAREWNIHNRKGKEAIKPQQQAVVDYGMILLEVRKQHISNNKYKEDVLVRRLDIPPFNEPRERTAALTIAEFVNDRAKSVHDLVVNDMFEGCTFTTAQMMVRWARKAELIPRKKRNPEATTKARAQIRVAVENGQPVSRPAVSDATGLSDGAVGRAQAMEQARLEGVVEGEALALNAQGKFTKAQAKHVEALGKKLQRDLNAQFAAAVEAQVNKQAAAKKAALDSAREACVKQRNEAFKDQQHWRQLINNRKPLFAVEEFRAITMALHPDNSASEETRARALQSFTDKKLQLTGKP